MKRKVFTAAMIALIGFTSCEETEDIAPTPAPQVNVTPSTNPSFTGADAVLVGVSSTNSTSGINTTVGTAVGIFNQDSNLVNVGEVNVNSSKLNFTSGNIYLFTPGLLNFNGIDFSSGSNWSVTGGNGFSAFAYNYTRPFPSVSQISSSATVSKSADYTLTTSSISGSDSVIFILGSLSHVAAANTTSHTFSVSDLKDQFTGSSIAMVAAYNYSGRNENGKTVYYVNESIVTKPITINN